MNKGMRGTGCKQRGLQLPYRLIELVIRDLQG